MANKNSTVTKDGQTGSHTSTTGGSTSTTSSHSEGGSTSVTQGYSDTTSSSQGGSHSLSGGKSFASGQVAENTQANFNKYNQEYVQSGAVADAYNNLQAALTNRPTFQSTYQDKLAAMYDQIMGRDKFSYDFNKDSMYQLYRDQFQTQGRNAMQDTMGQLSAMNGGYGSSYAQTAGQQTYQGYLQQLNSMIPELRNQAYQEWQAEGQDLLNKYNITADAYNREYGQYRDATSDWQSDRAFNQSAYSDERNFDYSKFQDNRNYWQNQYWQERNSEQSNIQEADTTNWQDSKSHTDSYSQTNTNYWENSNSTTNTSSWQNTDTTSWDKSSQTTSAAGGSGSGSGSSAPKVTSTADWSHSNSAGSNISSGNLVQQLYKVYQQQGDQGVENALGDLRQNGLQEGNTKYKFTQDDTDEIQAELRSMLDNIWRYSNGKQGVSISNAINAKW